MELDERVALITGASGGLGAITALALGRLDILINSAAWNDSVPIPDLYSLTPEIWDRAMNTNLGGPSS